MLIYVIDMAESRKFYKRGWSHTKTRGRESVVTCGFCGRKVPRYKTFPVFKGFRITDPMIKKEIGSKNLIFSQQKLYACPACARHRNIVRKKKR